MVTSQKSMHCTVTSLLLSSLSSLIVSYHFSHATQQAFFLACLQRPAGSNFTSNSFVIRDIFSIACSSWNAVSITLFWADCSSNGASFSYLLAQLASSCNGPSSVCPSKFWLECRSSPSDANLCCMDLLASVSSPLSSRFCATIGVIVVITVHAEKF